MDPSPIIPISLLLLCPLAALVAGLIGKTFPRAVFVAVIATCVGALLLPTILLFVVISPKWDDIGIYAAGGYLSAFTFVLAIPCGAATGVLAFGVRYVVCRLFGIRAADQR
jgi:hypothetical protein